MSSSSTEGAEEVVVSLDARKIERLAKLCEFEASGFDVNNGPSRDQLADELRAALEAGSQEGHVVLSDHLAALNDQKRQTLKALEVARDALDAWEFSSKEGDEKVRTKLFETARIVRAAVRDLAAQSPASSTSSEPPKTFSELRDRFVDPEKEKLRAELKRFRDNCPHRDMTLNPDEGTMTCDLCGFTERDPFAATQHTPSVSLEGEQRCGGSGEHGVTELGKPKGRPGGVGVNLTVSNPRNQRVVLWPHESEPGRCIHWPKTCAQLQASTPTCFKPCAHCCPDLYTADCKPPSEGEEGEEGWPPEFWISMEGPTSLAFFWGDEGHRDDSRCYVPRDSRLTKEQWVDGLTSPKAVAAARRAYERALGANPDDNFRAALLEEAQPSPLTEASWIALICNECEGIKSGPLDTPGTCECEHSPNGVPGFKAVPVCRAADLAKAKVAASRLNDTKDLYAEDRDRLLGVVAKVRCLTDSQAEDPDLWQKFPPNTISRKLQTEIRLLHEAIEEAQPSPSLSELVALLRREAKSSREAMEEVEIGADRQRLLGEATGYEFAADRLAAIQDPQPEAQPSEGEGESACVECGGPKPAAHPQFCADCGANYDSTDGD